MIIAVDGPAGAGKSSVTEAIAMSLGIERLDTGALYRAIALAADEMGLTPESDGLKHFVERNRVSFQCGVVLLNGRDVSSEIRSDRVSALASAFASIPEVRSGLLELQRNVGYAGDYIVDGRDIGTVVFPNADVKIFLTASVSARAQRRYLEYAGQADSPSLEQIRQNIEARDRADTRRAVAPLVCAEDAIVVDSSDMRLEEVVSHCISLIKERLGLD